MVLIFSLRVAVGNGRWMIPMELCHTYEKSGRHIAQSPEQKLLVKNVHCVGLNGNSWLFFVIFSELLVGLGIYVVHSLAFYSFLSVFSFHVNERLFLFSTLFQGFVNYFNIK